MFLVYKTYLWNWGMKYSKKIFSYIHNDGIFRYPVMDTVRYAHTMLIMFHVYNMHTENLDWKVWETKNFWNKELWYF